MIVKTLVIGALALIVATIAFKIIVANGSSKIEQPDYKVLKSYDGFEIRSYPPGLFSFVTAQTGSYSERSRTSFRKLAGYIFGDNQSGEKIGMTSPVTMPLNDSVGMMFMVPKQYALTELPKPNNPEVKFMQKSQQVVAAISFEGWANDEKIEKYKQLLEQALKREGIKHTENFSFLGYNPPYEIANRKNEIIVEIINQQNNIY